MTEPRSVDEVAKLIADEAVRIAIREGWEARPARAVFFVSDRMNLQQVIADWLDDYMRPEDD